MLSPQQKSESNVISRNSLSRLGLYTY